MNHKQLDAGQNALLSWYKTHGRHELPWRNTSDIYHIYVSEMMLQQTQVRRVMEEYYPAFLSKFPTLASLAQASESEVLAAWSGLGYYSRARNLYKTACECANAGLPSSMHALMKLPGIGRYTASAICSFGYHQCVGVVDTNIARVLRRFFACEDEREIWRLAEWFVNPTEPTRHNQALMDLGALICTPLSPKCALCPFESLCIGKTNATRYTKNKKTIYENLELFYGVCIQEQRVALVQSHDRMYKNMLVLPSVDPSAEAYLGAFKHAYTKYRLTVKLFTLEQTACESVWVELDKLDKAPIASITKKALQCVTRGF